MMGWRDLFQTFAGAGSPSPSNVTSLPDGWGWAEGRGISSVAGVNVSIKRARRIPVVRDCLQQLSGSISGLSFNVFERGQSDQREKASDHPIAKLLKNPNPYTTSVELLRGIADDLASEGDFVGELVFETDGTTPKEVWRVEPDHVTIECLPDRSKRFRIQQPGMPTKILLEDEVWHIPLPPLKQNAKGRSPILEDGVEAIGAAIALQDYANRFFKNDAKPPFIFMHKGNFDSSDSKTNFLQAWQNYFGGRNRGKPGVLEYDMQIKELGYSNEQSQFLETRKECWLDCARLWHMPPHKVGILDKATFSNIEHQSLEYVIDTLGPWLRLIESSVNKWLISDARYYFEFNVASLLRGDIKTRYEAYALGRQWGFLSVNELRKLENMNGIGPGGDRYMEPLNMAPVGSSGPRQVTNTKAIAFLRESVMGQSAHNNQGVL